MAVSRRFPIHEVDVLEPLPALSAGRDDAGVALVIRRGCRPVGFVMHAMPPGTSLEGAALREVIGESAASALLALSIEEELQPDRAAAAALPPPSLTVAVCTRDRSEQLTRCLEALVRVLAPAPDRGAVEIVVVDNAPTDDRTAACVRAAGAVRYVCEPRPGLDFARNRAVAEATGDFVAFVDDDAVVDDGWYRGFVDAWRREPTVAAVTGLVLPLALETDAQILFEERGGFRRGFARLRYAGDTLAGNPWYPAGAGIFGAGCNMVLRKRVVQALGGFDDALDVGTPTHGGGDLDMFYRIIRGGYVLLYEPSQLVFHEHRRGLDELRRQYGTWGRGFMSFLVKSWGTDRPARPRLAGMGPWWFFDQLRQFGRSVRGRHVLPPRLILTELRGGIVGLGGTYGRSVRTTRRRRERQP